jgi:hypothetical protein
LRVVHRRCVDTAILFPHPRGYPYRLKLQKLAQDFLQRKIQVSGAGGGGGGGGRRGKSNDANGDSNGNSGATEPPTAAAGTAGSAGGEEGHDSVEDASAAMHLVLLKAEKGPKFGLRGPACNRTPLVHFLPGAERCQANTAKLLVPAEVGAEAGAGAVDVAMVWATSELASAMGHCVVGGAEATVVDAAPLPCEGEDKTAAAAASAAAAGTETQTNARAGVGAGAAASKEDSNARAVQALCNVLARPSATAAAATATAGAIPPQMLAFLAIHGGGGGPRRKRSDEAKADAATSGLPATAEGDPLAAHVAAIAAAVAAAPRHAGRTLLLLTAQSPLGTVEALRRQKRCVKWPVPPL